MNRDKSVRDFERYMKKEHGAMLDDATENLIKTLQENEPGDYAAVIVSHVDKIVPTLLFVLSPLLTIGALYLIVKAGMFAHPMLFLLAVTGTIGSFFFAIKYDYAIKACRYSGIAMAIVERKNVELSHRVRELEGQLSGPLLKDEDIPF